MRWEELTADGFAQAARETGVCVVAMGVIEKHGDHLPLGTDYLNGHHIATLAAEKEPAIVFPPFYFGQIYEARSFPGTVTIRPTLLLELLEEVFDEISRNGIKKILLVNAHGGNNALIQFLAQTRLAKERDYALYTVVSPMGGAAKKERKTDWDANIEANWGGHAHEAETSISLATHARLVKMDKVRAEPGNAMGRAEHLKEVYTGINWYADFPDHYSGDAAGATEKKGKNLLKILVDMYAEYIRIVKNDTAVPGLLKEFYGRTQH